MIKVEGLTKRYARNIAVDHISFEVEKGQIVGFLGPNGAGILKADAALEREMQHQIALIENESFRIGRKQAEFNRAVNVLAKACEAMGMVLGQDGLKKYTVCVEKPKPPAAAPPGPPAAKPPASPSAN